MQAYMPALHYTREWEQDVNTDLDDVLVSTFHGSRISSEASRGARIELDRQYLQSLQRAQTTGVTGTSETPMFD